MSQSQQRLESSGLRLGFLAGVLVYAGIFGGAYLIAKQPKPVVMNITKLDLEMFEIGGGLNDAPPSEDMVETIEPLEEEVMEEVVEEIVEVEESFEELVEVAEIVEEIVEPTKEIVEMAEVVEPEPKPEPKPVKKPTPKKVEPAKKPVEKPKPAPKKPAQAGGYNAYNPNANKIASSAVTGEATTQNLSASEKENIGAQIQAIIAREAKKNYPRQARMRRQRGTVTISFTYSPNKAVTNLRVIKSSGHKILDDVAINAVEKTKSKFPPIKATTSFELPVRFTIN